jgi:alpha-ribazole phosphatase
MRETVLWLIRHPEPDVCTRGLCYGSLDVPLSEEGVRCAYAMAASLAHERIASVYASSKQRCVVPARILAEVQQCPFKIIDGLQELNFGKFEGHSYEELAVSYPGLYHEWMENPAGVKFPDGESLCDMSARVMLALREVFVRHTGESIAIVTHGGPIRAILADALGMPSRNIFRIEQRYGALNRIRDRDGVPTVELMNAASV